MNAKLPRPKLRRRRSGGCAWDRKFLGYSFWVDRGREVKRHVAPKALDGCKERIRQITSRTGGRSLEKMVEELRTYLLGGKAYIRLADTPGGFRDLDQWIEGCGWCSSNSGSTDRLFSENCEGGVCRNGSLGRQRLGANAGGGSPDALR